jgi:hypothetical protein
MKAPPRAASTSDRSCSDSESLNDSILILRWIKPSDFRHGAAGGWGVVKGEVAVVAEHVVITWVNRNFSKEFIQHHTAP